MVVSLSMRYTKIMCNKHSTKRHSKKIQALDEHASLNRNDDDDDNGNPWQHQLIGSEGVVDDWIGPASVETNVYLEGLWDDGLLQSVEDHGDCKQQRVLDAVSVAAVGKPPPAKESLAAHDDGWHKDPSPTVPSSSKRIRLTELPLDLEPLTLPEFLF